MKSHNLHGCGEVVDGQNSVVMVVLDTMDAGNTSVGCIRVLCSHELPRAAALSGCWRFVAKPPRGFWGCPCPFLIVISSDHARTAEILQHICHLFTTCCMWNPGLLYIWFISSLRTPKNEVIESLAVVVGVTSARMAALD